MGELQLEREGGVFILNLGDGENRIHRGFVDDVNRALDQVEAAPDASALVTLGEGKFYSNGFDLSWLGTLPPAEVRPFLNQAMRLWARLLVFPLPTVAALNGHAFGAGAVTALAHDWRVMQAERGYFCFPEVDLKLRFRSGMTALIRAKLAPGALRDALLLGTRYGASDAVATGLVDEAAPLARLRERAVARAQGAGGKDRATLAALKLALYREAFERLNGPAQPAE